MPEICLSVFAVVTAYADLTNDKIYNQMTVITMITGLTFSALDGGRTGMLQALLSVLGAFLLLFPVYFLLHGIGARDIKLWMALATFFPF
ncbi:MAG: prepilin peptidase, partial [Lachnospiraceae bacterium]|nr:prepilin peptidase [Lachnospiraceae bacterium]